MISSRKNSETDLECNANAHYINPSGFRRPGSGDRIRNIRIYRFHYFAFSRADDLTLPVGIVVAPFFSLTANLKFGRSSDLVYDALVGVVAVLLYVLTGWITGTVATLCFNYVAKRTGGIDVQGALTVKEDEIAK